MRREELFMDIIGGLDEAIVAEAMPCTAGYDSAASASADVHYVTFERPVVDEKAVRRMRIRHAVMASAAALALVVGIVVLAGIYMRRNITTSFVDPGLPGILYTPVDLNYSLGDSRIHVTGYEYDRLWCKLYFEVTYPFDLPRSHDPFKPVIAGGDDDGSMFDGMLDADGNIRDITHYAGETAYRFDLISVTGTTKTMTAEIFDLHSAKYSADIVCSAWDSDESFIIPVKYSGRVPAADYEINRTIKITDDKQVTLDTISVCPYMFGFVYSGVEGGDVCDIRGYRVIMKNGEELPVFAKRSQGNDSGRVFVQVLAGDVYADPDMRKNDRIVSSDDIAKIYVGDALVYTAPSPDPLEQADDTSMPEIFGIDDPRASMWDMKFQLRYGHVRELCSDERFREFSDKFVSTNRQTSYTLDDNPNIYCWTTALGISADDVCDAVRKNNEDFRNASEDSGMSAYIWTDEEIEAFRSGDRQKIAETFASEYSIVVGDKVFSPLWLYYHTIEDYKAAGITFDMVAKMLPEYEKLGLTDEAWKAFRKKLAIYVTVELDYGSAENTFVYMTDNSEPFGDRAFEILENVFYGKWSLSAEHEGWEPEISMTYANDPFNFEATYPTGIFETDEIYVIDFVDVGVNQCYFIEKDAPDIMYRSEALSVSSGLHTVAVGTDGLYYINRKSAVPEIKSGEISVLGLKKLFHTYGEKFEKCCNEFLDKERSVGKETDGKHLYLTNDPYGFGPKTWYLGSRTDSEVDLRLPYHYKNEGGEIVEIYADVRFSKNSDGDWDLYEEADEKTFTLSETESLTIKLTLMEMRQVGDAVWFQYGRIRFLDPKHDNEIIGEAPFIPDVCEGLGEYGFSFPVNVYRYNDTDGTAIITVCLDSHFYDAEWIALFYRFDGKRVRMLYTEDDKQLSKGFDKNEDIFVKNGVLHIRDKTYTIDDCYVSEKN